MKIKVRKLTDTAVIPTKGNEMSTGLNLYADVRYPRMVGSHETAAVGTGIAVDIPEGYYGVVFPVKEMTGRGLRLAGCAGAVGPGDHSELMISIHNSSEEILSVSPGERLAMLCLIPCLQIELEECGEFDRSGHDEEDM